MNYDQVPIAETFSGKRRLLTGILLIGAMLLVITLFAGFLAPARSEVRRQFAFSWLFAFLYFFTILIGCFFWIIVYHSTDSGWGILIRRQMENLAALIPYMAIFFIPLFLLRREIWNWIGAKSQIPMDPLLQAKLPYFELRIGAITIPFFWVRTRHLLPFLWFGRNLFSANFGPPGFGWRSALVDPNARFFFCMSRFVRSLYDVCFL
jgi:hypothetical protein